MSHKVIPTGRIRHRVQARLFRKPLLVLQVEERHIGYPEGMHGPGPNFDRCEWRDADSEDVTVGTQEVKL